MEKYLLHQNYHVELIIVDRNITLENNMFRFFYKLKKQIISLFFAHDYSIVHRVYYLLYLSTVWVHDTIYHLKMSYEYVRR